MIKLGLYSSIANPPSGDDMDRCVAETLAEAELAEACGFHGFFFGEHHQDRDGFLPSPLVVCSAVAARTKTLQIGTSVLLLPLHHPLRVAEDVVTLDAVSGGRMALGVGLGYQEADFRAMGIDKKHRVARFEEGIDILRKAWTGEYFDHKGRHFDIENVRVTPRPIQKPCPPIWLGAWVPTALERAGRLGDAVVMSPSWPLHESAKAAGLYREAARAAGNVPQVVMMRDAWVADTLEDAARVYGPEVMDAYRYYWRNGANAFHEYVSEDEFQFENVWKDRIIIGSPESCVAEFKRWSEVTGSNYFLLRLRHAHSGGPPHSEIMAAIERFGRDVIPYLGG
ncbi:MAG: Alkanal monooxygenase alpha chain [Alphaproteobacteria bacterium MarineAlpha4_Bin2]|nr:MAG: Alkanal monooxygenase alpha chain [Alphaproteobacteria bacterium MarineAlpha4_Bin2]